RVPPSERASRSRAGSRQHRRRPDRARGLLQDLAGGVEGARRPALVIAVQIAYTHAALRPLRSAQAREGPPMSWRVTCSCAHWIAYAPTREIAVSLCEQHRTEQPERAGHITALTDIS